MRQWLKNSGPSELSVPKRGPVPNFQFRTEIKNSDTSFLKLSGSRTTIPSLLFQRQTLPKLQKSVLSVPKNSQYQKKWEIDPKRISQFSQVEIPQNHGHKPNLKRNRFKFLKLCPSEQSVPKLPHFPNPYFGTEIWNSDDATPEISYI